jgi:hypothetical protein
MNRATNMPCVVREGLVAVSLLQKKLPLKRQPHLKPIWRMMMTTSATTEMIHRATWLSTLSHLLSRPIHLAR